MPVLDPVRTWRILIIHKLGGDPVFLVQTVIEPCLPDLAHVAHALDRHGLLFRLVQGRKKHAREDGDDRNHHKELDQRETFTLYER